MKKYIYQLFTIPVSTLALALIWFGIYSWQYNHTLSKIEFDGPAGSIMILALIAGATLGAVVSAIIFYRKYKLSKLRLFCASLVVVVASVIIVGAPMGKYMINHYTYHPPECSPPVPGVLDECGA